MKKSAFIVAFVCMVSFVKIASGQIAVFTEVFDSIPGIKTIARSHAEKAFHIKSGSVKKHFDVQNKNAPASFWKNLCDYKTDGKGKSVGLKLKISIPCAWTQKNGDRPHIEKKFTFTSGSKTVIMVLGITREPASLTKAEIDEVFTKEGLRSLSPLGIFLSGRKLKIDGLDCAEVASKIKRETPLGTLNLYHLQYFLFYNEYVVSLSYSVSAKTDEKAKLMFENYKTLFRGLAGSTVVLSRWE